MGNPLSDLTFQNNLKSFLGLNSKLLTYDRRVSMAWYCRTILKQLVHYRFENCHPWCTVRPNLLNIWEWTRAPWDTRWGPPCLREPLLSGSWLLICLTCWMNSVVLTTSDRLECNILFYFHFLIIVTDNISS